MIGDTATGSQLAPSLKQPVRILLMSEYFSARIILLIVAPERSAVAVLWRSAGRLRRDCVQPRLWHVSASSIARVRAPPFRLTIVEVTIRFREPSEKYLDCKLWRKGHNGVPVRSF